MTASASTGFRCRRIDGSGFGARLEFETADIDAIVAACRRHAAQILDEFYGARGLLVIGGLQQVCARPQALVELSRLFGPEVENYRLTLTSPRFFHPDIDEILVLGNEPPCNHPPPPRARGSAMPYQFPHQQNWHTDQSYRRPPPDVSLLFAVKLPPPEQGQTLFADCGAAWSALGKRRRRELELLHGIHAPSWVGRSRRAVENGETPLELLPHQLPQRQPLVRRHPVTGARSLYICEENQMDYVDGPVAELEPGPRGAGAALIRELLELTTRAAGVYAHRWQPGDLVIADNRNLLHCATWYDAARHARLMWRTTVMGNPGAEYRGERKSWLPLDGSGIMAGMEHA